jgi:CRISP-associated protein Cas1
MSVPELVPARMLNEFSYCPRLFYIEWVQARFADNDFTVDGSYRHRRVDRESSEMREDAPFRATSVLLSSQRLGLVAKADLIVGEPGRAVPVDYKRGPLPDNEQQSFEPERVQLCAVGLLLREEGYTCDYGEIYYSSSRTRVRVDFSDELVKRTESLLAELRQVATRDIAPTPLIDSPKCPRCSLVGLCLPDETNALAERSSISPRRLLPSDQDRRPLYVTKHGSYLSKSGDRVVVKFDGAELASIRLRDVSQICLIGNAQISTQLMRTLFNLEIPVMWFSSGGWLSGTASGLPGKNIQLRRQQYAIAAQGGLLLARRLISGKIRNSRTMLMRNAKPRPNDTIGALADLAEQAGKVPRIDSLLGIEGTAARLYFQAFPRMLRSPDALPGGDFTFEGRNRRPPRDAVNALLSFLYSILVKDCLATTMGIGFDPYMGVLHRPQFGRPALALDLAEEFRPLISESVAITVLNNGELNPGHFIQRGRAVTLTEGGRRVVLRAYERRLSQTLRHPEFGYLVSYRRALEVQARILAAVLLGEIPEYVPLVTR